MGEDSFWALIAECREQAEGDTELMSRVLFRRLRVLSAADVAAFAWHWERARSSLYSWPVADAACLMLGTAEEDHLPCVRDWIISFGRAAAGRIARDPDSLADFAWDAGRARAAWFDEFITEAIIATGRSRPPGGDPAGPEDDPAGPEELTAEPAPPPADPSPRAAPARRRAPSPAARRALTRHWSTKQ